MVRSETRWVFWVQAKVQVWRRSERSVAGRELSAEECDPDGAVLALLCHGATGGWHAPWVIPRTGLSKLADHGELGDEAVRLLAEMALWWERCMVVARWRRIGGRDVLMASGCAGAG